MPKFGYRDAAESTQKEKQYLSLGTAISTPKIAGNPMTTHTRQIRSHHDLESAIAYLRELDTTKRWQIEIKPAKSKRSLAQNRLLWSFNSQIQQHMREHFGEIASAEDWHEILVSRLLPTRVVVFCGEPEICRTSTRKMSVAEMSAYLEMLEMYCADNLGLQLTRPEDIYYEVLAGEGN